MEIQLGHLKYLVGRLDDRNNSYGKSLRLRYAKELSRDDNQSMIPLKETMDSKRISKEGHKVCRTAEQKSAAGLDNWQIWIPTPPDTQIPLPLPVTGPDGDVRIAVPQALTRLYNDSENLSLSFRYRHVMQTGLMGDLTMEQFEAATSQLSAFEYVPEQHVNLELQDAVIRDLRAYINQNSAILSEDEKEKHAAIVNMTTREPQDVQTINMFFQFIVSWFVGHESSLVRAELEFIRGSVKAGCGRTMAEVVQDGELIVPILYVTWHFMFHVTIC